MRGFLKLNIVTIHPFMAIFSTTTTQPFSIVVDDFSFDLNGHSLPFLCFKKNPSMLKVRNIEQPIFFNRHDTSKNMFMIFYRNPINKFDYYLIPHSELVTE